MKRNFLIPAAALVLLSGTPADAGSCSSGHSKYSSHSKSTSDELSLVETAVSAGTFETLVAALTEAELVTALSGRGPFTVFAPTDEAFAKLPKGTVASLLEPENRDDLVRILKYHVVPSRLSAEKVLDRSGANTLAGQRLDFDLRSGQVFVDDAQVAQTDIHCSNGIIHVIDSVLMPATEDLLGTAKDAGTFGTLLAALDAADLDRVLEGDGPFTVFAPTDDAFAKLPAGTVESLLEPENADQLASILKYHVVSGRVFAAEAVTAERAKTVQGSRIEIALNDGRLQINDALVLATDVEATNGVIHVVDSVLLPN